MSSGANARTLLAASEEILLLVEAASRRIVEANEFAARSLRYEMGQLIGRPVTDLECALQDAFYWDDVAAGRLVELDDVEGLMSCGDGELLPVTKSIRVVGSGPAAQLVLKARDARASAAAAEELDATTSLLRSIFESTAEGLLVLELNGGIMNFNHRFAELWNLDVGAGCDDRAVLRSVVRQCRLAGGHRSPWRQLLSLEEDELERQLELFDGRSIRVRARPLLMQEQVRGRVLTCSDITERITYERELAAARDAAAASERAKASFLAMMSHEIRTPMAGILGMTEIAGEYATHPEQQRFLGMARASAEGLLVIINDLLDFSKIEAGKFQIESIPFDLGRLLDETLQPLRWQAENRNLSLELEVPPELPRSVVGDPTRLRQIVINLIGNAMKFTERGGVTLRVEVPERSPEGARVRISVIDTGIGIAPERQKSVFEAFTQSDAQISRRYGGTGLGLTICARLCELMNGRIWVDSTPGVGSTFSLELPLALASEAQQAELRAEVAPVGAACLNILLAEDTEVNQVFLRHILERAGHSVTLVDNGLAAFEQARAGSFDVVLMDVQMPGMDGFEATEKIRAAGLGLPVVGLTAHAMEGIRDQCLAHGMSDYLSKPVRANALLGLLARIEPQRPATAPGEAREARPAVTPETVAEVVGGVVVEPAIETVAGDEVLMRERAIADLGGDADLWADLLAMLWDQAAADIPLIREGIATGDLKRTHEAAHRFKSSLAMVGAIPASAACARLDEHARSGDAAGAGSALEVFERRFEELCRHTGVQSV